MTIAVASIKKLREATGAGPLDCRKALQASGGDFEKAVAWLREKGLASAAKKTRRETKAGLVVVKRSSDTVCAVEVDCETDFVAFTDDFKTLAQRLADQVLADGSLTDAGKLLAARFVAAPGQTTAEVVQGLVAKLGENIVVRQVARYTASEANAVEGYIHAGDVKLNYGPTEDRIGVLMEMGVGGAAAPGREALGDLMRDLALHIAAASPRYLSPEEIPGAVLQQQRDEALASPAAQNKPEAVKAKIVAGQLEKFRQKSSLLKQAFVKDDSLTVESLLRQKGQALGAPLTIRRFARLEVGL